MIARRFAVFALSAAVGFGIALHQLPGHHAQLATTVAHVHSPLAAH